MQQKQKIIIFDIHLFYTKYIKYGNGLDKL